MSFLLKAIFEGIEEKEKIATKLYKNLSLKTRNSSIKEQLEKLSKDEFKHSIKINENMNFCDVKIKDNKDIIKISETLKNNEIKFDLNKVISVLDSAIGEEHFATEAYRVLSNHVESPLKEILITFSKDEERHAEILEKLKAEFNSSDWE